jgi:hypothetical protein
MNKEQVLEVVNEVIVDRLTQLMEEMSNDEFVQMITDIIQDRTGKVIEDEDELEEIRDLIGSRVVPLLHKVCEWGIGKEIPTE